MSQLSINCLFIVNYCFYCLETTLGVLKFVSVDISTCNRKTHGKSAKIDDLLTGAN